MILHVVIWLSGFFGGISAAIAWAAITRKQNREAIPPPRCDNAELDERAFSV